MTSDFLQTPIEFLKTVGPFRAEILKSDLGIHTFQQLLYYYPFRYIDRSKYYHIKDVDENLPYVQIVGRLTKVEILGEKSNQRLVAQIYDGTGGLELVWFRGHKWILKNLKVGSSYVVIGKAIFFNSKFSITHPEIEEWEEFKKHTPIGLQPVYNSTEKLKTRGLDSRGIWKLQKLLIQQLKAKIPETLPLSIIKPLQLLNKELSIIAIHLPENVQILEMARFRLKFEELFYAQLSILKDKAVRNIDVQGYLINRVGICFNEFYSKNLPFALTEAQKRVVKEIRDDLKSGRQMNRLLQGDVGSGKTMVALMTMLLAIDNGFQACMMAPTEILANQHAESISKMLSGLDISHALLTGSVKSKQRKQLLLELSEGKISILIGTHAVLEDPVVFKNLGIVVIDEQHKFGVAQRARLWKKNILPPHILVMTATPIPRTLAMTFYGDLDVSVIDELPPGRKPVKTLHLYEADRFRVLKFMKAEIDKGRQAYVVYPLINESETLDLKDLNEGYENIIHFFPLKDYGVSVVHGQQKGIDKDIEMQRFISGQTQIMVATTVIEVGVNVPNASIMIIENAERFGLSQLHQLRGRVGRGAEQSFCILMTKNRLSSDAKKRMETMVATNDGFKIAEVDMEIRGPGDLTGTQQSGNMFNLANLVEDFSTLQLARDNAQSIINNDPRLSKPENYLLFKTLQSLNGNVYDWSKIS